MVEKENPKEKFEADASEPDKLSYREVCDLALNDMPEGAKASVLLTELLTLVVLKDVGLNDAEPLIQALYQKLPWKKIKPDELREELKGMLRQGVALEDM